MGSSPPQQRVELVNLGTGNFALEATKTKPWLNLFLTSDSAPSTLLVSPLTGALPVGIHRDTITVTATSAIGSPRRIPVLLTIGDSLLTSLAGIVDTGLVFDGLIQRSLTVTSAAGLVVPFALSEQASWLSLSQTTGTTPQTINITIDPSLLPLGEIQDTITISSSSVMHAPLKFTVRLMLVAWRAASISAAYDFSDVVQVSPESTLAIGYTLGSSENTGWTFWSGNDGKSWQSDYSREPALFSDVDFVDTQFGWIVGDSALMLFTLDAGESWLRVSIGDLPISNAVDLRAIYFSSSDHGWAVGTQGKIIASTDGGATWQSQSSGTDNVLTDVQMISAVNGWVVGNAGTILKSTNGTSWTKQTSGTSADFWAVAALTSDSAMVVGNIGICLVTTNGGVNWTPVTTGTSANLLGVAARFGEIFVVGSQGKILRTATFGQSFVAEASGTAATLKAVMIDQSRLAIIVGDDGTILRSRLNIP